MYTKTFLIESFLREVLDQTSLRSFDVFAIRGCALVHPN